MLDNLGEYDHPLIYDAEYGGYQGDFDFYLNLIEQGKVLDLACGTGRLTIPFAQKGFDVTGLDESKPMLERAREKAKRYPILWKTADIRDFDLNENFDLIIMGGNSFQALLTNEDQVRMLECVKQHLKPSGIFAFDTRNPNPDELRTTSDFEYWHSFVDPVGETVKVYGKQVYDFDLQIVTYTTKRIWGDHETLSEIKLQFTEFETLIDLVQKAGLTVINVYGDYQKTLYSQARKSIIVTCGIFPYAHQSI